MDNNRTAHIVYASDDAFAEILGISIMSLLEHNMAFDEIYIYILDSGIKADNKSKIEELCKKYYRPIPKWIEAVNISESLGIKVEVDRGSLSQYARLFISSNLPQHLERVLYLDCDTLILDSIYDLWNIEMEGKTIAALNDAFSFVYRKNIDLKKTDIMFNSGVMMVNLERWKQLNIEKKLLDFISKKNGVIQQGDQGVLNHVLSKDCYCFSPKFNAVTIYFDFEYDELMVYRKPIEGFYTKAEIQSAVSNPVLVHFTTSFISRRPWILGCKHPYCEKWLEYKANSPWKDSKLRNDIRPIWKQYCINIFNFLPRKLAIYIAGILQAYGRPIIIYIRSLGNIKNGYK